MRSDDIACIAIAFSSFLVIVWNHSWKIDEERKWANGHLHDLAFMRNSNKLVTIDWAGDSLRAWTHRAPDLQKARRHKGSPTQSGVTNAVPCKGWNKPGALNIKRQNGWQPPLRWGSNFPITHRCLYVADQVPGDDKITVSLDMILSVYRTDTGPHRIGVNSR